MLRKLLLSLNIYKLWVHKCLRLVLHRETYGQPVEQQLVDDYDQHIAAFYREQGLSTPSWSQQAVERLRSIHTLNGREHISAVLKGQRFEQK